MKRPQPDLTSNIVNTFVAKTGANRKLKRLWGTKIVNGVEVLNSRRFYHKADARPANYERLFKYLRVYKDIKDYEGDGVKSAWFTINKSKSPENLSVLPSFVTDNLNSMWWDSNDGDMPADITLTTTITISEDFINSISVTGIDWSASKEVLTQYVTDNYESLWNSKKIVQEGIGVINKGSILDEAHNVNIADEDDLSPDDPWMAILSRYALRDDGIPCTIKDIEVGIGTNKGSVFNTMVVTLEIPYRSFSDSDLIVKSIMSDISTPTPHVSLRTLVSEITGFVTTNGQLTKSLAKQITYYETADDIDVDTVSRVYTQWEDSILEVSVYDNYWLQDGDVWYLKADVIDNPKLYGTTHVELNTYIFGLFDTGYKKEKVPVWKKVVAVVVFIVAVVVAYMFPPAATLMSKVMLAAYAILVGALVVSLVTAALGALGYVEWSMAFAWVSREIEPLVTVASIIMVVGAFIQSGAIEAIKQYAIEEINEYIYGAILGEFGDLGKIIADAIDGSLDRSSLDTLNDMASVYTTVQLGKLESINDKNNDLKAEYDKLAKESSRESDIMKGYMSIYAKPATADWSMYSSVFDMPYERGGGILAMGNIQKTTKQATRKADYKEPMFDGILFV